MNKKTPSNLKAFSCSYTNYIQRESTDQSADAVRHMEMREKMVVMIPVMRERIQPANPIPPRKTKIAPSNIKNAQRLRPSNSSGILSNSAVAANIKIETIREYVNITVEAENTTIDAVTSFVLFSMDKNCITAVNPKPASKPASVARAPASAR
jgi:hypothetical protein